MNVIKYVLQIFGFSGNVCLIPPFTLFSRTSTPLYTIRNAQLRAADSPCSFPGGMNDARHSLTPLFPLSTRDLAVPAKAHLQSHVTYKQHKLRKPEFCVLWMSSILILLHGIRTFLKVQTSQRKICASRWVLWSDKPPVDFLRVSTLVSCLGQSLTTGHFGFLWRALEAKRLRNPQGTSDRSVDGVRCQPTAEVP